MNINEKTKNINQKLGLSDIKSNFILKKIINNVEKVITVKLINYNKKLQQRLNLTIDDYKQIYTLYCSPIEIELKVIDDISDEFINIREGDNKYFHIYFDDSNQEIKRNYLNENEKVKTIKILIDYHIKSLKGLFSNCIFVSSINFKKFTRINITDMSYMFFNCVSLKELKVFNFNTNNVIDMSYMFCQCRILTEINLCNFNTDNLINTSFMFYECSSLKKLVFKKFNKDKVTNKNKMFDECPSLDKSSLGLNPKKNKKYYFLNNLRHSFEFLITKID